MPTYEYICQDCRKRFSLFQTYAEYGSVKVTCTHCQSENVLRRIGRIRTLRSEGSITGDLGGFENYDNLDGLGDDPKEMGRMLRRLQGQAGEEMGPEFDEVVQRLERGQTPEQIEKELPDIGSDGDFALPRDAD